MQTLLWQLLFLISLSLILYFFTQQSLKNLFHALMTFVRNEKTAYILLSIIYFPGTILHELSHFITALSTGLKVRTINVFPQFIENNILLGEVTFEKKDFVRSIMVGVAPFFYGLGFFFLLAEFNLFPNSDWFLNLLFGYLVFAISSTMFSSKQDLKELGKLIPLIIVVVGLFYVFDVKVETLEFLNLSPLFLQTINLYLVVSILVNVLFIILSRFVMIILRK